MKTELGKANYTAWKQNGELVVSASGVLPCINQTALLEIVGVNPPKCAFVVVKQPVCLTTVKPFTVVLSFGSVDGDEVVVLDSDGETRLSASTLLRTRNWAAIENRQPPLNPNSVPFYIVGEVETTNGALRPTLRRATPQGFNPRILLLDLTIESSGFGTTDVNFRSVRYDEQIQLGQFTDVSVRHGSQILQTISVQVAS